MFKELYFWMYSYLSIVKSNKTPAFNAYLIISSFQIFNLATVIVWINYFLKINIDKDAAVIFGLLIASIFAVINYFFFYKKREYIFTKYQKLSPNRKTKGKAIFWSYILLSLIIFFLSIANLVDPKY
jgi:hypothetical protein